MQWTGLNDLREKYLSFFESKGHLRLPSFPLIPKDDNSLLLINTPRYILRDAWQLLLWRLLQKGSDRLGLGVLYKGSRDAGR